MATPSELIHSAVNQALQGGNIAEVIGALYVALKTVETLYAREVVKSHEQAQPPSQPTT